MMAKRLLINSIPFFSNIGLKLAREMESTANVTYEKFLTNPCLNKLSLLSIDEETTIKIIDGLKAKNSEGVDGLSVKLLKAIKYETSKAITHIINQSYGFSQINSNWLKLFLFLKKET